MLFFESIAFQFHFEVPWKRHWTWGTMDFLSQARHTLLASELFPGNAFGYGHSSDGFLNMFPISTHFRRQHHTHSIMYIYVYLFIYICLSFYPKTIINRCNWCFFIANSTIYNANSGRFWLGGWPRRPFFEGSQTDARKEADSKGASKSKDGAVSPVINGLFHHEKMGFLMGVEACWSSKNTLW